MLWLYDVIDTPMTHGKFMVVNSNSRQAYGCQTLSQEKHELGVIEYVERGKALSW
jgi:hypothetical protein